MHLLDILNLPCAGGKYCPWTGHHGERSERFHFAVKNIYAIRKEDPKLPWGKARTAIRKFVAMFFIVSALSLGVERTEAMMTNDAAGISTYKETKVSINASLATGSLSS